VNLDEVGALLAICAAFDYRNPGAIDLEAWEAAVGDLAFADAREAVVTHYRSSRERIMPADVRRGVSVIRRSRVERLSYEDLLPDGNLALGPRHATRILQLRRSLILDGMPVEDAVRHTVDPKAVGSQSRYELS
jgi:hypothetical protein